MDVQPFTDWLATLIGIAFALAGIVSALVAVIKTAAGKSLAARYYPVLSLTIGVLTAIAVVMVMPEALRQVTGFTLRLAPVVGGLAGLVASELFSNGKSKEVVVP